MLSRRTQIQLIYENKDIANNISADLERFSFSDNISGIADDISITLNDKNKKYVNAPLKTSEKMQATITTTNWNYDGCTVPPYPGMGLL